MTEPRKRAEALRSDEKLRGPELTRDEWELIYDCAYEGAALWRVPADVEVVERLGDWLTALDLDVSA